MSRILRRICGFLFLMNALWLCWLAGEALHVDSYWLAIFEATCAVACCLVGRWLWDGPRVCAKCRRIMR